MYLSILFVACKANHLVSVYLIWDGFAYNNHLNLTKSINTVMAILGLMLT